MYIYDIKIQTDINQNSIKQIRGEIEISSKIKFFETKQKKYKMNWARPSPIVGAWPVLTQLQGCTQPSRVGWADVLAQQTNN